MTKRMTNSAVSIKRKEMDDLKKLQFKLTIERSRVLTYSEVIRVLIDSFNEVN